MTPTRKAARFSRLQSKAALPAPRSGSTSASQASQPRSGLLEREYKVELFHRIGRGVRLTPAGAALLPMVRRLFASLDEATAYLQDLRGQRQGHLRVGSYTPHRFIGLVARYKKRFPGASICVE